MAFARWPGAPVAVATIAWLLFSLSPARFARADDARRSAAPDATKEAPVASLGSDTSRQTPPAPRAESRTSTPDSEGPPRDARGTQTEELDPGIVPQSVPVHGNDQTGVSSHAISLPQ